MSTLQQLSRNRWAMLSFIACMLLALAGKLYDIPFLFGITYSLTSAFLLLGLRLFGYWPGLLAAAAVYTAGTQWLGQSLFDYIGLLEIAVVGLLIRKFRNQFLLCNTAFWLLIAIPLTYITHASQYASMKTDLLLVTALVAGNGLLNALLAEIAHHYLPLAKWTGAAQPSKRIHSFSRVLYHFSLVCVVLPLLLNVYINSASSFQEVSRHAEQLSANVSFTLKAEIAEGYTNLQDSSPSARGSLLQSLVNKHASSLFSITVTDGHGVTLAARNTGLIALNGKTERTVSINGMMRLIIPDSASDPLYISTWHNARFTYKTPLYSNGLYVQIDIPIQNYQYHLFDKYFTYFIYWMTFALFAVLVAQYINRWLVRSLKRLAESTYNLPSKLKQDDAIDWPASNIAEIRSLIANYKQMAGNLVKMFNESQRNGERLQAQAFMLRQSEEKLHSLAYFDMLTGLPNRLHFTKHFRDLVKLHNNTDTKIAVMFADINRFKQVNDTLGHAVGDRLLKQAAERFTGAARDAFEVFRLGGDEFVFVGGFTREDEPGRAAQAICDSFAEPFMIERTPLYLTVSVGISIYPIDGDDMDTVISNADIAMYSAKEEGDGCCRFYKPKLATAMTEKMQLENGLYNAIHNDQFSLHYQPKMNAATGALCGIEALIRWHHPELGLVPPDKFIPLAEQSGFILEIDRWVFREACRQNKAWQDAGLQRICVSVNISGRHFYQGNLIGMINAALEETGLAPEYVSIEITEGVFMRNMEQAIETILYLRKLGIQISMDDFGTGYSSLNQLQRLPISDVKLDRSFIQGITKDEKKSSIVRAIIELVHSMNMKVVAEGVETHDESQFCKELKCDELQGYLFSRPLPPLQFEALLAGGA